MSIAGPVKPWYSRDLFEVLGWRSNGPAQSRQREPRNPLARWDGLIMANTAARREAKAALFGELAEAVRQGMPMDQALSHASQTFEESRRRKRWSTVAPGAESRHGALDVLVAILMTVFGHLAYMFFALLALRMVDVERISRLLALRLLRYVVAGYTLSEAMRRCTDDYEKSEVQMIEAGERWGTLAEGLKRMSQFQVSEQRLSTMGTLALYPFWVGGILMSLAAFCLVFIVPKFKDIYDQLGAELPAPTQMLLDGAMYFASGILGLVLNAFWIGTLVFFLLRSVMNGTRLAKLLLGVTVCLAVIGIGIAVSESIIESLQLMGHTNWSTFNVELTIFVAWVLCAIVIALLIPYILDALETFVLRMERRLRPLLRFIPIASRAVRVEQQSRWLGALSLGLSSGVPPDQALRAAGMICGGELERRSLRASELAAAGHPIGAACVQAKVLDTQDNYRLALLDGRPDYLQGLRSVAEDSSYMAFEWLSRSGRVAEIFMILALGVVAGLFAIAMYLPLFNIPKIVGIESSDAGKVRVSWVHHGAA